MNVRDDLPDVCPAAVAHDVRTNHSGLCPQPGIIVACRFGGCGLRAAANSLFRSRPLSDCWRRTLETGLTIRREMLDYHLAGAQPPPVLSNAMCVHEPLEVALELQSLPSLACGGRSTIPVAHHRRAHARKHDCRHRVPGRWEVLPHKSARHPFPAFHDAKAFNDPDSAVALHRATPTSGSSPSAASEGGSSTEASATRWSAGRAACGQPPGRGFLAADGLARGPGPAAVWETSIVRVIDSWADQIDRSLDLPAARRPGQIMYALQEGELGPVFLVWLLHAISVLPDS